MKTTTAALLLKYLQAEGVDHIFGVPGTALVRIFDAANKSGIVTRIMAKRDEVRPITRRVSSTGQFNAGLDYS